MAQFIAVGLLIFLPLFISGSQNEMGKEYKKSITINGKAASSLISLFTKGNDDAKKELSQKNKLVVHDLEVTIGGPNSEPLKISYWVFGTIGDAKEPAEFKGAEELYGVFATLGLEGNASMGHFSYEISVLSCEINTGVKSSVPERFQCKIVNKYPESDDSGTK